MSGECLSYGAFGAYHTAYNTSDFGNRLPGAPKKCTKSWTNFLSDVRDPLLRQRREEQLEEHEREREYDHELHAGLKDFSPEATWVIQRYTPWDERTYAPVPRFKYNVKHDGAPPPNHWIPPRPETYHELSKFCKQRWDEEKEAYHSFPYTRDECWSTLREMKPSRGRAVQKHPPNWGTYSSQTPQTTSAPLNRFPIIQSPMTRFVSDMHLTNRQFNLF